MSTTKHVVLSGTVQGVGFIVGCWDHDDLGGLTDEIKSELDEVVRQFDNWGDLAGDGIDQVVSWVGEQYRSLHISVWDGSSVELVGNIQGLMLVEEALINSQQNLVNIITERCAYVPPCPKHCEGPCGICALKSNADDNCDDY